MRATDLQKNPKSISDWLNVLATPISSATEGLKSCSKALTEAKGMLSLYNLHLREPVFRRS